MLIRRIVLMAAVYSLLATTSSADAQLAAPKSKGGPKLNAKVNELIEEVLEAEVELSVTLKRSKIIRMKRDVFRAAVADPSIIEIVAFGSREVEVIGVETGTTSLTLWVGNEGEQQSRVLSILVTVTKDTGVEDRRRLEYGELQQMLNEMFPNSKIQLIPVADKLIVRGQARDEQEAMQIMSIVRKNAEAPGGADNSDSFQNVTLSEGEAAEPFPDAVTLPQSTVISMLRIPGEKQVLLKVRIAEVKRSAIRQLGVDFDFDVGDFFLESVMAGTGNLMATGTFDNDSFNLVLNALSSNGTAKILAEPNLVVISGQEASFIAGGEFAVPTVVGVGGAQAATTRFKGFGTQLTFLPTVLDRDRIRLNVSPTFSTLNQSNSVNGIFGLDTRAVSTTVELREGQVLAIAGLLQEQQRGDVSRVPLVGKIPLINALFSNKDISRDETELIILVSPELVHPLESEDAPSILPGMELTEPDDLEFFIHGHIEGCPDCHHRSTVWPLYRDRFNRNGRHYSAFQRSQAYYIHGPSGFSD